MARLRFAAFAGIGIMAALAVLPHTRWILLNDGAILRGQTMGTNFYGCLDPNNWPDTPDFEKAKAVGLEEIPLNPLSQAPQLRPLADYCRKHPKDASAWAHLVRMAAKMAPRRPELVGANGKPEPDSPEHRRREALMAEALEHGEQLEPDNAYFAAMRGVLLASLGKVREARASIQRSSRLGSFQDYSDEQPVLAYRAGLAMCGYRGARMEVATKAGVVLPQYMWLRRMPLIQRNEDGSADPATQIATLRLSHHVAQITDDPFTLVIMKAVFLESLFNRELDGGRTPEEEQAAAQVVDSKLGGAEVAVMARQMRMIDYNRLERLPANQDFAQLYESGEGPSAIGVISLLSMIFVAPLAGLGVLLSRMKRGMLKGRDSRDTPRPWILLSAALLLSVTSLIFFSRYGTHHGPLVSGVPPPIISLALEIVGCVIVGCWLIWLPSRGVRPGALIALALAILPFGYLWHVVQELDQNRRLERLMVELPKQAELIRGDWRAD